MAKKKSIRKNLYLRGSRDADLIKILEEAGVLDDSTSGDFSYYIRGMMRESLTLRALIKAGKIDGNIISIPSLLTNQQEEEREPTMEEKFSGVFDEEFKL